MEEERWVEMRITLRDVKSLPLSLNGCLGADGGRNMLAMSCIHVLPTVNESESERFSTEILANPRCNTAYVTV